MRKVTRATVLAVALAFASIWIVLATGATAVWLTGEVRAFGLVALPTAIVASVLVVYFDWRQKLLRRMLRAEDQRRHALAEDEAQRSFILKSTFPIRKLGRRGIARSKPYSP